MVGLGSSMFDPHCRKEVKLRRRKIAIGGQMTCNNVQYYNVNHESVSRVTEPLGVYAILSLDSRL